MTDIDVNITFEEMGRIVEHHFDNMLDDIRSIFGTKISKKVPATLTPASKLMAEDLRILVRNRFKCITETKTETERIPWKKLLLLLKERKKRLINWPSDVMFPTEARWHFCLWTSKELSKLLKVDLKDWSKGEKAQCGLSTVLVEDQSGQPLYTIDNLVMNSPRRIQSQLGNISDNDSYVSDESDYCKPSNQTNDACRNSSRKKNVPRARSHKASKKRTIEVDAPDEQTVKRRKQYSSTPVVKVARKRLGSQCIMSSFSPLPVLIPSQKFHRRRAQSN